MLNATITVTRKVPPAVGKKRWSIFQGEDIYGAMPPVASMINEGFTYEIAYKEDYFNGKTYKVIEGIKQAPAYVPQQVQAALPNQPNYVPQPQPSRPPAQQATPQGRYAPTDSATAERIFVCGAINAILSNSNVPVTTLTENGYVAMINALRKAWERTFGGKPTVSDDLNDEIPI